MASEKVFVDSDILLDLFLDRKPFSIFSEKLFDADFKHYYKLCTSSLIAANMYYIITRQRNKKYANDCISVLLKYLDVLPIHHAAIAYGLTEHSYDFEDAVQLFTAIENDCKVILTRNLKDFKHSGVPAMTAENYFKLLKNNAN